MPIPLKVLIAEDNLADCELTIRELRRAGFGPQWQRVDTEKAFSDLLDASLDLVLSDYHMPQFTGLRALELVKQSGFDVPFILISGTIGEDVAVQAMRNGASDYLMKDRLTRLGAAVNNALAERKQRRERRASAEALRVTSAQLRQVLEHSPAVLYVSKVDGGTTVPRLVTEGVVTLLGFSVAEASSYEWWLGQLHPDDRERAVASRTEALVAGASVTAYRMRRKDGTYCWIEDTRRLIRDASGKPIEMIGVWTDVTERKRAEVILRQASGNVVRVRRKKMYIEIAILMAATVGIYLVAFLTSVFSFVPKWFLRLPMERMDEVILTSIFIAAGLAIFAFRRWRESELEMTSHQQLQAALVLLHDELNRRVQQRTAELDAANGALRAEAGERRRAMEALGESETQFRQVVENIHEVFWIVDAAKGRLLYVSPTYEGIWGRTCKSAYSKDDFGLDAIHPDDFARVMKARRDKESQGNYDEEFRIVRPDASIRWIQDRAFPVRCANGELHRIVGVAEDVTERKQLKEQFLQVQKMEAMGTLAGGIAHDFNNILTAIIGYTELGEMSLEGNPKVRTYLAAVLKAASRATGLIRQILTFSRRQAQERKPIKLLPVVDESLKLLRSTVPTTIEFDMSLAVDTPTVLADANQIHQILMNLGTNAWYAMKSQTGRLKVTLEKWVVDAAQAASEPRLHPGIYTRISVGDTGCGMNQATLQRLFEPFFTTKPPGEGTGLGLAVVHGIMDSHDGIVTVESRPGEGTTFRLYFPAHAGEAIVPPAKEGTTPRGNGERILVLDDEEVLALLVQRALVQLGYDAVFATEPRVALDMVRADPGRFALVLTDQTMPTMTGLQLSSELRLIRPELPVIMMTGYTAPHMAERVAAAGIRELLLKPVTMRSLGLSVHAALTGVPGGSPGSTPPYFPPTAGPPPAARSPQPVGA
jgi:PAS domain S-box-containing protein